MHPKIIDIGDFSVYSYGLMIVLGAAAAYWFLSRNAERQFGIKPDKISSLMLWIFVAAFVGGKLLFYLEDPATYLAEPSKMLDGIGNGFVFYGSLLFAVPTTIWFFRKEHWKVWPLLDLLAFTILIVHAIGRIGCFMAGCCHGVPTDAFVGVTFTHPLSQAEPLGVPLHPTQLYSVLMLTAIFVLLYTMRKRKAFDGQLFLLYVMLYSVGRSIIETVRGDEERGFIVEGLISHSQFISALLVILTLVVYAWRRKQVLKSTGL